jgi:hypothetical protein
VNGRESVATSACAHRSRTVSVLTDADTLSWCDRRGKVYRAIEWRVVGTGKHEYVCDLARGQKGNLVKVACGRHGLTHTKFDLGTDDGN